MKMQTMVLEGLELKYVEEVIGNLDKVENNLSKDLLLIGYNIEKSLNGMLFDQVFFYI